MNYEAIMGDICYEWSLGVFPSRALAEAAIKKQVAHVAQHDILTPDDVEFDIAETSEGVRGPIWPSNPGYDEWLENREA